MASCSVLAVSRSAQVASTRSLFALTQADTASSFLFHVRVSSSPSLNHVHRRIHLIELNGATLAREDLDQVAEGVA
ncbi:hypothetical protein WH47_10256 [Habropoda laboriosa]|uniref:Uncharacterized protein n=1 Tax=Habropoda laboriosa TaxID=597456 RepID=A0A0L7R4N7_9HYME|nr:hypothetical protein WH47_10256 [Habropoda laboriosa]